MDALDAGVGLEGDGDGSRDSKEAAKGEGAPLSPLLEADSQWRLSCTTGKTYMYMGIYIYICSPSWKKTHNGVSHAQQVILSR